MSAWVDNARPVGDTRHVIEAAVFELSFGDAMADWAKESRLERFVEMELMEVVNEVFDESAATGRAVRVDSLQVDLGSLIFDGSWTNARERLREGLRSALVHAHPTPAAGKESRLRSVPTEPSASAAFDIVAYFLRFGVLPAHARVGDGRGMDALVRERVRSDPQRLAALIRSSSSDDIVSHRLARQISEPVLRQVASAFSPAHAEVLMGLLRRLQETAASIGSGSVWEGELRPALWSRLLTDLAAARPPEVDAVARRALEIAARCLGRTYREIVIQLSGQVATSADLGALIRRLALGAVAPRTFSGLDDLVDALEHGQPKALGWVLDKLTSGDLPLAVLSDRLSLTGHRRLVSGILAVSSQKAEDASELEKAVESFARRAGSAQAFYRQVLQRLVHDELIDLDAIGAASEVAEPQGAARREAAQRPVAEPVAAGTPVDSAAAERALGAYLGEGVRVSGADRQQLMDTAEHLLVRAPERAGALLRGSLADEAARARLVALLPERLLTRALYALGPGVHARVQRYADAVAGACGGADSGLGVERIAVLKWRYCLAHLLSAPDEVDLAGLVQGLTDYLGAHAQRLDGGALRAHVYAQLAAPDRQGAGDIGRRIAGILAAEAPTKAQAPQRQDVGAGQAAGARLDRADDLYARLAQRLGGTAATSEPGSGALSGAIDELAREHPDRLRRVFAELRSGVLSRTQAARLTGEELRALVQAYLSLPPATGEGGRTQLAPAIDAHARRAGSAQAFYRQVLQRLVDDELIDLEAIGAASKVGQRQDAPRQTPEQRRAGDETVPEPTAEGAVALRGESGVAGSGGGERAPQRHPTRDAAVRESRAERAGVQSAAAERALGAYLGEGVRVSGADRQQLMDTAEHLLVRAPERAGALLRGSLADEAARARLVALLPERLLTRALYALGPGVHARVQRYADAVAGACGGADSGLGVERIAVLKWQYCLDHLLSAPDEVDLAGLVQGLTDYLGAHAQRLDGGALRAHVYAQLAAPDRQGAGDIGRRIAGILAAEAPTKAQAPQRQDVGAGQAAGARLDRADDLYARLAQRLGGTAATSEPGSGALSGAIDELAREHPDRLRRVVAELRSGVLSRTQAARLTGEELRALVQAYLSLPPATGEGGRTQLARAIDAHARRAGSAQAFYRQVLQRLVDDELIDLEAIGAASKVGQRQDAPRQTPEQRRAGDETVPEPTAEGAVALRGESGVAGSGGGERAPQRHPTRDAAVRESRAERAGVQSAAAERALGAYLGEGVRVSGADRQQLMDTAERLLVRAPERAGALLRGFLADEAARARLVALLPERLLTRALYALGPGVHARVQRYADAVAGACGGADSGLGVERIAVLKWQYCLAHLLSAPDEVDLAGLVQGLTDYLGAHAQRLDGGALRAHVYAQLAAPDRQDAGDIGRRIAGILSARERAEETAAPGIAPEDPPVVHRTGDLEALGQGIPIANAGQVLAAPYLPRLFGMLDLLDEGGFKGADAQERAVHLLQFMVNKSTNTPEYDLVLNKVLCGLDTAVPVCRGISVTEDEKAAIEGMLRGMIQHWKAIGNTSIGGLRESFLQREGTLRLKSSGWHLTVEPKAFDMLLDRLPWSISTIKHSWMEEVIHVVWR